MKLIEGIAAVLPTANLDTDQIMPKQFLRGIDKQGLAAGVLYDLRFDGQGRPRPEFVLNQPAYAYTRVLVAGPNFGCGSSREHAVWGLLQYGIRAVVAPSYGEIFQGNALNNRLLALTLPEAQVRALMQEAAEGAGPLRLSIDVAQGLLRSPCHQFRFTLSERHRRMFLEGVDLVGATLARRAAIEAFAEAHWARQPWLQGVAAQAALPRA
jgi:3-isopropylmalate/(R)-2-methylmalate dehydratase small subunit